MSDLAPYQPVDYLIIGHVTQDLTYHGPILGGTASYAALTASRFGLKVGLVTSCSPDLSLSELRGIQYQILPSRFTTTFENVQTPNGRVQTLFHQAGYLTYDAIPPAWRNTPIIHLGPVAKEIDPQLCGAFPNAFVGLTPQGWLRDWDENGKVFFKVPPEVNQMLKNASAVVMSIEDVCENEQKIEDFAMETAVLVVTESSEGCRLYWNRDLRRFRPPEIEEIDGTGAGDIFATAFFYRLHTTHNPWEAARFATQLASISVTRAGILAIPTPEEVQNAKIEILQG